MAIPAISIRNFVANGNGDDIEGIPSHLIDKGSFPSSDRVWFRKTMESERIARLEVLAQEFFRLLRSNQPETNLGWDENTHQFYVLSEAVERFHPLPRNQKQKFTNGAYRGLGRILVIAVFLQEVDLRNTNLGLNNNNEVIKQGSRYLVKDFSPPWLKLTRQRAKLKGRDRPASGTLP